MILVLLAISPAVASVSDREFSPGNPVLENTFSIKENASRENVASGVPTQEIASVLEPVPSENLEEGESPETILASDETLEPENTKTHIPKEEIPESESPLKTELYINIAYLLAGAGAAVLVFIIRSHITVKLPGITSNEQSLVKTLKIAYPWKTRKLTKPEDAVQEKSDPKRLMLLTGLPVLSITLAELLIFSGNMGAAVWLHIGNMIALSLSTMFIKDPEINKLHQALMLLPVLRLVNLSMPIFFDTTLYTFIFIYGPLSIPVIVIALHQRQSLEQLGITLKHIMPYMVLSIPLGFLLGLGEYLTIHTGALIPDLSFVNLLKLTLIMVFFVGLVEELIFRSILQTGLEEALGIRKALLISSFLFGLMHSGYGTFNEILYTGFVGFIMGFAFYKTKSLPFIATIHGFVNVFLFGVIPLHLSSWTFF